MKPDRAAVAGMSGRELDAAVCSFVFGILPREIRVKGSTEVVECQTDNPAVIDGIWTERELRNFQAPEYSTDLGPSFFAMISAVRQKGWWPTMELTSREEWTVDLTHLGETLSKCRGSVEASADTLPLAFARAALLTTYSTTEER